MIYECKLEGLEELGLRLFKKWCTQSMRPGTNLKLSTKRVIINNQILFIKVIWISSSKDSHHWFERETIFSNKNVRYNTGFWAVILSCGF